MLTWIVEVLVSVVTVLISTIVLSVLILFPFSPVRAGVVVRQCWQNRRQVIDFGRIYSQEILYSTAPKWILVLGLPFVAMLALLEDYA